MEWRNKGKTPPNLDLSPVYQKKKRVKAPRLPQKFYNLDMKEKIHKTNAARQLDELNIPYELIPYKVNEEDLSEDD